MLRRVVLWLLVVGFVWTVFSRIDELEHVGQTLLRGEWRWLLVAAALQVAYYGGVAATYQAAFSTVGIDTRGRDLLPVLLASLFVNTVAPSGGMAGTALLVDEAARRGQPGARAAAAALLARIGDSIGFSVWMLTGLVYLLAARNFKPFGIAGALVLVLATMGLGGLLLLGLSRPDHLRRLLDRFAHAVNRVMIWSDRPAPLANGWADRQVDEFAQAGVALGERPQRLIRLLIVALAVHLINMASLHALFLAFRLPPQTAQVIAVYIVAILFWKTSPVPEGVGVVEGAMVLAAKRVGVPAARAAALALAFRGLVFWIPLLLGFVMLRRLRVFRSRTARSA